MDITIPDEQVWKKIEDTADAVIRIETKMDDVCERAKNHEDRIINLEKNSKSSTVQDWLKKGGIGAGSAGLAGTLYLLLDKLIGLGGT